MENNIVIISLERAKERRIAMQEQIAKLNLKNVHILDGVDGSLLDPLSIPNISLKNGWRSGEKFQPGEIGCIMSHTNALQLAKDNGWNNVIIFEDDITIAEDFEKRINFLFKIAKTKYGDIHVYENDWIGSVLLDGKYFEEELVDIALASIKENSNVLDIGANVGVFSKAFLSKKCFVHAFEPQKKLVNLLNKTFEGETAIKIYHNAVGDIPCVKTMNIKDGNGNIFTDNGPINLGGIGIGIGGELVNVIKIDDLKLENVSVLKIDVEGFEKNVIYGAMNMIKKEKPFICFESHHLDLGDKAHILSFLINEGYNCIEKEIDGTRNYICLYKYNKN